MNRYFLPPSEWKNEGGGDVLFLTGDEAKHCTRVMRAKVGEAVELFDGAGRSAVCEIESVARSEVRCRVVTEKQSQPNPHPITLYQAIPKGGNMELIVQKSVELGVATIQPLITAHTVARPDAVSKKQAKWQRIALEACKQCGQNYLPEVKEPQLFSEIITEVAEFGTAIVAALDERAVHVKTLFETSSCSGAFSLLVGPEGDFSPEEYQKAYDVGFSPVSFGEIVLRVETATLYGLSVLQHEISAMK